MRCRLFGSFRLLSLTAAVLLVISAALPAASQDRLTVMTTTTILADVARNVAGDLVTIEALLPPDADTHAYEPTTDDVRRIAGADALIEVGAGYEGFIADLLANAGADIPVYVASHGIEILPAGAHHHDEDDQAAEATPEADAAHENDEHLGVLGAGLECGLHSDEDEDHASDADADADHAEGECDPHVWMDPLNVAQWARSIANALGELDPANAATYAANAAAYAEQMIALDAEIAALVATVPEDRRVIVTNHEFMAYFAHRYGFEVAATVLPGASTDAELDPRGAADLIALLQAEGVAAIFAEVSANPELAGIIAQEAGVQVVTELYSESLSAADGPAATYIDFMRHNAQTIVAALNS